MGWDSESDRIDFRIGTDAMAPISTNGTSYHQGHTSAESAF